MLITFSSTSGSRYDIQSYIDALRDNNYQVSDIVESNPFNHPHPEYLFTIVINSVNDLFNITKIINKELIISLYPMVEGTHEIEIYDDYRE